MLHDALDPVLAQAVSPMRLHNEHVSNRGVGSKVADDPGEANLRAATIITATAQRVLDRSRDDVARDSFGPIAIRPESVNHLQIEASMIGANQELTLSRLYNRVRIGRLSKRHLLILNCGGPCIWYSALRNLISGSR